MPVAASHKTQGLAVTGAVSSANFTPTAGGVVVVTVGLAVQTAPHPDDNMTVSGLGATWTKLSQNTYASRRRAWLFIGVGATASSQAVTMSYGGAALVQEMGWVIDEVTGLNTTTPTASPATVGGDTAATTATVTTAGTPVTGDGTYSSLVTETNTNANVEAGWAALGETTSGTLGVRRVETAWDDAADTSHTWTWDGTSQGRAAFITILKAATAGSNVAGSQASVTNTANAGTPVIRVTGSQPFITHTAFAGTPLIRVPGSQASASNTANTGSIASTVLGSKATTTSVANSGTPALRISGAQAAELSTANTGTPFILVRGSLATETYTANAGATTSPSSVGGSLATVTHTAFAGVPVITVTGSRAIETNTANSGSAFVPSTGSNVPVLDAVAFALEGIISFR